MSGNVQQVTEHYQIDFLVASDNSVGNSVGNGFVLTPKNAQSHFSRLSLKFDGAVLNSMMLTDSLAQTTTFSFRNVRINQPIDNSIFEFSPPDGVDIITDE